MKEGKICIGSVEDFPEGKGRCVEIDNKKYAVYRYQGELGCITNECVHKKGPLCDGWMRGSKVVCPWHFWEFDFKTGKGFGKESQGGLTIWEEEGKVYVDPGKVVGERVDWPAF